MKQNMEQPTLTTENLVLTPPSLGELKAVNEFEVRNKNHLANWESTTCSNSKDASLNLTTQNRLEGWIKECGEGDIRALFYKTKSCFGFDYIHIVIQELVKPWKMLL